MKMRKKESDKKEERTPVVPLRRSPRFHQIVLPNSEDPRTPNQEPRRRTRNPPSATPLDFTGNSKVSPRWKSLRSNSKGRSQELGESCNARQTSVNSKTRSSRSTKLTPHAEESTGEKLSRSLNRRNRKLERRVTRSSCSKEVDTNANKTSNGFSSSKEGVKVNICKKYKPKLSKKKDKDSNYKSGELDDHTTEGTLSVISVNEGAVSTPSLAQDEPTNKKTQKIIGVKRKRNQVEGISGISHGWTKDQELALERAYLQAKPTPHFWKKVSRLVHGKSAQECFDKIHGSHLTPPPPRVRCRARVPNSHDPNLSASKFLSSSLSPTTKKPKSRKQKSHVIQRTVRHMLQNQYKEQEQEPEPDLFSVLEPAFTQSLNHHLMLMTPVRHLDMEGVLKRSSTSHKKSLSRFSGSLVSPPVLKEVKNKALHDKYIDQLHCREASRKVGSKKGKSEGVKGGSSVKRKDAFRAAKNALVFGARDAINEFECKQGMALIDIFEDECLADDENEDEDAGQLLV